ncbi:MAG: hypothetical protein RR367_07735 [Clostridia bacterium]
MLNEKNKMCHQWLWFVTVFLLLLTFAQSEAIGEDETSYDNIELSNKIMFTGMSYNSDATECYTYDSRLASFESVTPYGLVDKEQTKSWNKEERSYLASPDTIFTSEQGDWLVASDGRIVYSKADARASIDQMSTLISMTVGCANRQEKSRVMWMVDKNPLTDCSLSQLQSSTLDCEKIELDARNLVKQICNDQKPILANCLITNIADHDYMLLAYALSFDDTIIYGPTELVLPIVNKDFTPTATPEYVLLIYNQDGLCYIDGENILLRCSDTKPIDIISYDNALSVLIDIIDYTNQKRFVLQQSWLSYMPMGDAYHGTVSVRPFWCFYLEYEIDSTTFCCTARIDAQSGELLW